MKTNKIIVAKNPDGRLNSITIMDYRHANMSTILSTPEPTSGVGGWMRQLHSSVIDTEFRLSEHVVVDLADIEHTHHRNWHQGTFDENDYLNTSLPRLMGELINRNNLDVEIESLIQSDISPITEYAQISHYLDSTHTIPSRFKTFRSYAKKLGVKGLTYMVQHITRGEHQIVEYAMGVEYLTDRTNSLHLTFDPVKFLEMIHDGRFIYCGEFVAIDCLRKPGELNMQLANVVERKITKVMQRMTSSAPVADRTLDAIFL